MDTNLLPTNDSAKKLPMSISDLFKRPGGTMAKITAVAAACGLGYGFFKALPFLIAGAANTLVFIAELVAIAAILMIITSKSFWTWISLFWYQLNKLIISQFVKMDPITILEISLAKMEDKLAIVRENVKNLKSTLHNMEMKLQGYEADKKKNITGLKKKKEELQKPDLTENDRLRISMKISNLNNDIVQLEDIINSQKERIKISKKYQNVMERLQTIAEAKIERSRLELQRTKDAYESAKEQQSALKAISSIMKGDMGGLAQEMAIDHITKTINDSVAEMELFINDSNGVLENYNLESAINEERVKEILAKYDQGDSFESFNDKPVEAPYQLSDNESYIDKPIVQKEPEKVPMKNRYF